MQAKTRIILSECIERGVSRGYARAYKHNENPTEEELLALIENSVMAEIDEYFEFDTP